MTDISDSVRIQNDIPACEECGSTSRVGRGFCLNCLLHRGLGCDTENTETLKEVLDEVDVRDADWRIGNYQILEEIGRGGMGVIYRARQRHSRRIVALKRVLSFHADSRETLARFRREAEAAASLDHPNILPIYEVSESEDGLPFFSMKFAAGGSLVDVARSLRADPRRIVRLIAKVTRAVQHAHGQGILHRDLKPGNILLDGRGEPLVSDFGLAKWLDASSDLTRTLTIFGTPGYIAPEQAQGPAKNLTAVADIYSIGAVLFDLFTGRPPFLGEHALAVIKQATDKPAPKLRTLAASTDRDLETICSRCLEREPSARYRSASDLAEDLERWLEGRPIIARPVSPPVRIWRWSKRNPVLAGAAAICIALGSLAVAERTLSSRLSAAVRAANFAQRSVAVAPFEDLDDLTTKSPQAREITRLLTTSLAQDKTLRIRSTLGAFPEEADLWRSDDWRKIGETLGTRVVFTGTVRKRSEKQRIVFRLIEASSGRLLSAQTWESEINSNNLTGWTAAAISQLNGFLQRDPETATNASQMISANPLAQEYVRAGKEYYNRLNANDTKTALDYFTKAVAADPKSAVAQALYSLTCSRHSRLDPGDSADVWRQKAEIAASAAVKLDPNLAIAHKAVAACANSRSDEQQALDSGLSALELDPTDQIPAAFVAWAFRAKGRPDLALRWWKRSASRDQRPGANAAAIGDTLSDLTDDDAAERAYAKQLEFLPDMPDAHVGLARLSMFHRDFDRARTECQDALKRYPNHFYPRQMLAEVEFFARNFAAAEAEYRSLTEINRTGGTDFYGCVSNLSALAWLRIHTGSPAEGRQLLKEANSVETKALAKSPHDKATLYSLAAIDATFGQTDLAIQELEKAVISGWIDYRSLQMDPRFDSLREDSRFKTILENLVTRVANLRRQQPAD